MTIQNETDNVRIT